MEPLRSVPAGAVACANGLVSPKKPSGRPGLSPGFTPLRSTVVIPSSSGGGITILTFVLFSPHPFVEPTARARFARTGLRFKRGVARGSRPPPLTRCRDKSPCSLQGSLREPALANTNNAATSRAVDLRDPRGGSAVDNNIL